MTVKFTDTAPLTGTRITTDGYLVGEVLCARAGCQTYLASELGLVGDTVTVYRPEDVVFDRASLASFAGKPVTMGHPTEAVTAENWKAHAIGDVGTDIARDGEFVRVHYKIMDGAAIAAIQAGDAREVSMGYTTPVAMQDGTAPDGTKYQAVQTGPIRINHLAVVKSARGGSQLRIGDGAFSWGSAPITLSDKKEDNMSDALKMVVLGDKAVSVAVADAPAIEAFKSDQAKALTDATAAHEKALAVKDATLAAKDAEIAALQAKVMTDVQLDARVSDRAALVTKAKAIAPDLKTDGLADAAIRKAAVVAKIGDMAGKSDAYIDARFDILCDDAPDLVADALKTAPAGIVNDANKARAEMIADMKSGKTASAA